jgi:hypothetical protein
MRPMSITARFVGNGFTVRLFMTNEILYTGFWKPKFRSCYSCCTFSNDTRCAHILEQESSRQVGWQISTGGASLAGGFKKRWFLDSLL